MVNICVPRKGDGTFDSLESFTIVSEYEYPHRSSYRKARNASQGGDCIVERRKMIESRNNTQILCFALNSPVPAKALSISNVPTNAESPTQVLLIHQTSKTNSRRCLKSAGIKTMISRLPQSAGPLV